MCRVRSQHEQRLRYKGQGLCLQILCRLDGECAAWVGGASRGSLGDKRVSKRKSRYNEIPVMLTEMVQTRDEDPN